MPRAVRETGYYLLYWTLAHYSTHSPCTISPLFSFSFILVISSIHIFSIFSAYSCNAFSYCFCLSQRSSKVLIVDSTPCVKLSPKSPQHTPRSLPTRLRYGTFLWVHILINVLLQVLQYCLQQHSTLCRVITAPNNIAMETSN